MENRVIRCFVIIFECYCQIFFNIFIVKHGTDLFIAKMSREREKQEKREKGYKDFLQLFVSLDILGFPVINCSVKGNAKVIPYIRNTLISKVSMIIDS